MSTSVGATSGSSSSTKTNQSTTSDAYDKLDTEAFLKLLVTELQNQDPMEPTDSSKILDQLSSIRSIQSNDKLSDTLSSVTTGQSLSTASSLIGKTISGLNSDGDKVSGTVDRVEVADGKATLYIGEEAVSMENVTEINSVSATESTTES